MSLQKKIILSFFISAFIIAILAVFEYVNFLEIKKEILNLEITDTVRSKSLQLRRHEKNFFLNADLKELDRAYNYVRELKDILGLAGSGFVLLYLRKFFLKDLFPFSYFAILF